MKQIILLSGLLSASFSFSQVNDGLVMDVPFTYGNVFDQVGTNHGYNIGATPTDDRFGVENMALYFDGADFVYFGDNATTNLDNMDEITITAWIEPANGFSGMRAIVAKWNDATNEEYGIYQDGLNGVYTIRTINNMGTSVALPMSTTGWYFVAFTFNKTTNQQNLYVNNSLVSTYTPGGFYTNTTSSTNLTIGAQYNDVNGSGAAPNRFFQGAIDDVRIYDRVLSAEEIDTLYEMSAVYCKDIAIDIINVTNTSSNTGVINYNVSGGHAPYQVSFNGGTFTTITSGKVCSTMSEANLSTLTAPGLATFTSVNFASYGNPSGTCGEFIYANCHSPETMQAVQDSLLGNYSGTFMGANATFGYDPCFGTGKNTRIMVSYAEPMTLNGLTPGDYTIAVMDSLGCMGVILVTVEDLTAGVHENESILFDVYPNPAQNELTIITDQLFSFNIVNITGEIISTQYANGKTVIDISDLAPGVYFIQTQNGQVQRFVKSY
ncbi:MAG: T9SS type A sorting domain-containing protein [Crocinitomicaceae bacterium]|nr:T9SS type A sorting domain-containing protein [Crocinitomicaceae bacterium]MBK8927007.1 T9SS type A sorting domain-containing protein [Crocinitomicaceae bacterium]